MTVVIDPAVFIEELVQRGLVWRKKPASKAGIFHLNLNSGTFYLPADPEKVLRLVMLARRAAKSENYGMHNALLSQTTLIASLREEVVTWRPKYISLERVGKTISLRQWLKENWYPYLP